MSDYLLSCKIANFGTYLEFRFELRVIVSPLETTPLVLDENKLAKLQRNIHRLNIRARKEQTAK